MQIGSRAGSAAGQQRRGRENVRASKYSPTSDSNTLGDYSFPYYARPRLNSTSRKSQALRLPCCMIPYSLAFLYALGATLSHQRAPMKSDEPQGLVDCGPAEGLSKRHGKMVSNIISYPVLWSLRLIYLVTGRSSSARPGFHKAPIDLAGSARATSALSQRWL
ncbi:hypothetical protein L226DRAFT_143992 [Lentinus tigrinus ALCF2SS1-7]|uniref:Uncharacterized protein n=1 Tax=Lentinus tigrinus ALCF2SS1-6 TaxID=1328759 RepID=A0A5C2RS24_9APHY|nr:hypothetical protein L227DRAFT_403202 [Lentinus tigrinus ALCF2SS1-6]RPD72676.1 hypothetical protein L226DRAFT_143992 [Lentinus tigrinus ALCF2SS1-7]